MKKSIYLGCILAVTAFSLLSSCDKIDAPYVVPAPPQDTAACTVPEFPALTSHFKRVLLEDYTGHNCPNCPRAGLTARDLKVKYQDSLVVVAVHAGFFAKISTSDVLWSYDFRTEAGTEWDNFFKVGLVGNPNGMVSRKGYPENKQVLAPTLWANAVKSAVAETPVVDLQLITEYSAADDKLCIHAKTTFLQAIAGRTLNLSVIITEDSIVQPQKNSEAAVGPTPQILDYVHMHVMRGAVNGIWGTPVLLKESTSSDPVVKTYPVHFTGFNLNTMIPKNCRVVAFVYDADTKEVLQVAERDVIE